MQERKPLSRPATMKPVDLKCDVEGCKVVASHDVFGGHGIRIGRYCYEHGANRMYLLGFDPPPR